MSEEAEIQHVMQWLDQSVRQHRERQAVIAAVFLGIQKIDESRLLTSAGELVITKTLVLTPNPQTSKGKLAFKKAVFALAAFILGTGVHAGVNELGQKTIETKTPDGFEAIDAVYREFGNKQLSKGSFIVDGGTMTADSQPYLNYFDESFRIGEASGEQILRFAQELASNDHIDYMTKKYDMMKKESELSYIQQILLRAPRVLEYWMEGVDESFNELQELVKLNDGRQFEDPDMTMFQVDQLTAIQETVRAANMWTIGDPGTLTRHNFYVQVAMSGFGDKSDIAKELRDDLYKYVDKVDFAMKEIGKRNLTPRNVVDAWREVYEKLEGVPKYEEPSWLVRAVMWVTAYTKLTLLWAVDKLNLPDSCIEGFVKYYYKQVTDFISLQVAFSNSAFGYTIPMINLRGIGFEYVTLGIGSATLATLYSILRINPDETVKNVKALRDANVIARNAEPTFIDRMYFSDAAFIRELKLDLVHRKNDTVNTYRDDNAQVQDKQRVVLTNVFDHLNTLYECLLCVHKVITEDEADELRSNFKLRMVVRNTVLVIIVMEYKEIYKNKLEETGQVVYARDAFKTGDLVRIIIADAKRRLGMRTDTPGDGPMFKLLNSITMTMTDTTYGKYMKFKNKKGGVRKFLNRHEQLKITNT